MLNAGAYMRPLTNDAGYVMKDLDKHLNAVGITYWEYKGIHKGVLVITVYHLSDFTIDESTTACDDLVNYLGDNGISDTHLLIKGSDHG